MWVIMQTGFRTTDGSAYGFGTSHIGPSRKLTAVCRTEAGATKWLRRLERWASDRIGHSDLSGMIATYETMKVDGLAGLEPALFVGPAYYGEHGREASLRQILLGVRESHTALRRESRCRQHTGARTAAPGDNLKYQPAD
jgi:hypothetical protein